MLLLNIPAELRARPQWVCCGPDKVPINPRTRQMADPTDPKTWATFEEAVTAGFKHVGYVLHKSDPYTIIDLDNKVENPAPPEELERFDAMIRAFGSYTERSASGRGYHIILRGAIPKGARRGHVEVYSDARFMICTGDVLLQLEIHERQDMLDNMYAQLAPTSSWATLIEAVEEEYTDQEIHERAMNADNGDKYDMLTRGPESWREGGYPSQSEADLALMSMYTFYSKSNNQCRRLFLLSPLGKREKAHRPDYMERMLRIARTQLEAKTPPPIDYKLAFERAATVAHSPSNDVPSQAQNDDPFVFPPGIVGEVAEYILATSIRPVREIALAAAIAFIAGITGRTYNTVTKSGLNQYIIVLAKTGCGKEAAASGIDKLVTAVRSSVPAVHEFVGPAHFASGPAIIKTLSEQACFVSVLGEVGITLRSWSDPRANAAERMIFKVLLDAHNKSGFEQSLKSSAYSDRDKNTKIVQAPALTILGESVPESFYASLTPEQISSGLIPRFLVIEYKGERPDINEAIDVQPPQELVAKLANLVTTCLTARANNACHVVPMSPEAMHILRAFNLHCDKAMRESHTDVDHQLYNRGHLNALRLSTLLAVGENHMSPRVSQQNAEWACRLVASSIEGVLGRFARGEVGEKQVDSNLDKAIRAYLGMTPAQRVAAGAPARVSVDPVLPFKYFYSRLRLREPFKSDRLGPQKAIENALAAYVKMDMLHLVPPIEAREKYRVRNVNLYIVGDEF